MLFDGQKHFHTDQENAQHAHDYKNHYVEQQYLPDDIKNQHYYIYGNNKVEQATKEYWDKIKKK